MSHIEDILEIFVEAARMTPRTERLPDGFLIREPLRQYAEERPFHLLMERRRACFRRKYATDEEFRLERLQYCKAYYEANGERIKARAAQRRIEKRDQILAEQAERRKDPAYREHIRELNRQAYARRRARRASDPAYLEHEKAVKRAAWLRRQAAK